MIAAILALFTATALVGQTEPLLTSAHYTLEECQIEAAKANQNPEVKTRGLVAVCLVLRTNV